jgi:sulfur-carrier protein adenylyltransferase/sulfurtransferase
LTEPKAAAWSTLVALWGGEHYFTTLNSTAVFRLSNDIGAIGWLTHLPPDYIGRDRKLSIVLRAEFPHVPPEFFVNPSPFLEWPHAESSGKICLWPEDEVPTGLLPSALMEEAVERFRRVFHLVDSGSDAQIRSDEFAREWVSYWRIPKNVDAVCNTPILLLSKPGSDTTLLASGFLYPPDLNEIGEKRRATTFVVAGSDSERLRRWAANTNIRADFGQNGQVLMIPLAGEPGVPGAPGGVDEVQKFISTQAVDPKRAISLLNVLIEGGSESPIWLIFSQKDGALAGLRLMPKYQMTRKRGYQNSKTRHQAQKKRRPVGFDLAVIEVQRADPEWLQERGLNPRHAHLPGRHVVIVGAGSLGSMSIEGLAMSGVGTLTLVDPGFLESANIGRHTLGVASIGQSKVFALRARLLSDYPHLTVDPIKKRVQELRGWLRDSNADVVICTTADPASEAFLMESLNRGDISSLLISWAEPHALAGHSAHSPGSPFALEDIFQSGRCVKPITEWANSPVQLLPGCGASHTPGAGNRIRLISAMIVEHVISVLLGEPGVGEHRMWAEASDIIETYGGRRHIPSEAGDATLIRDSVPQAKTSA